MESTAAGRKHEVRNGGRPPKCGFAELRDLALGHQGALVAPSLGLSRTPEGRQRPDFWATPLRISGPSSHLRSTFSKPGGAGPPHAHTHTHTLFPFVGQRKSARLWPRLARRRPILAQVFRFGGIRPASTGIGKNWPSASTIEPNLTRCRPNAIKHELALA